MNDVLITATGLATPKDTITNAELVDSFNAYVKAYNEQHAGEIAAGDLEPLSFSDADFIKKASGIESRFVIDKKGILDINTMHPLVADRSDETLSLQAELAVYAARDALQNSGREAKDIDAVICACSAFQRSYPAMSIEIQKALGIEGFAFDMNVACSSATFAITQAKSLIDSQMARSVLIVSPEICSSHINFKDRDSHFIFGDACTAILVERQNDEGSLSGFKIVSCELKTDFSNNIRNNSGALNRLIVSDKQESNRLFKQNGRKVFKEVSLEVTKLLSEQLVSINLAASDFKRLWLHQANSNMNRLIATKFLGFEPDAKLAPIILKQYANTASAGSIIAFHQYRDDLKHGDLGLLCSFGAGYSIGSIIVEKIN